MAVDLPKIQQTVAEGLLYDLKQPMNAAGLMELEKEGTAKGSSLTGYREWRKALDHLVKSVGIVKDGVRGIVAPDGLKPEGFAGLNAGELKSLATFGAADNAAGRKSVVSMRAGIFLGEFHARYATPIMEIMQDKVQEAAAGKLTAFWQKHIPTLVEITKDNRYAGHSGFVSGINKLAKDGAFSTKICTPSGKASDFAVDSAKLSEGLMGRGASAKALSELDGVFFAMAGTARSQQHDGWTRKLNAMQQDFNRDVQPALRELKTLSATLAEMHSQQAASAQYRYYT